MLRPIFRPAISQDRHLPAGLEVARLVEDVVRRQETLDVDLRDASVAKQGRAVLEGPASFVRRPADVADEGGNARAVPGEHLDGLPAGVDEPVLTKQVARRIADDSQLAEDDEVRAGVGGFADAFGHRRRVLLDSPPRPGSFGPMRSSWRNCNAGFAGMSTEEARMTSQ